MSHNQLSDSSHGNELPGRSLLTKENFFWWLISLRSTFFFVHSGQGYPNAWPKIYDGMKEAIISALLCSQDTIETRKVITANILLWTMIYERRYGWHKDVFILSKRFDDQHLRQWKCRGQLRIPYNTFPLTKALIVETFGKNKNIFVSPIASFVNHCYIYEGAL